MDKRISETITYEISIKEKLATKKFVKNIDSLSKKYNKSPFWKANVLNIIDNGVEIVFIHDKDIEEQVFEGIRYPKIKVYKPFIGFSEYGHDLFSLGDEISVESTEELVERFEKRRKDFGFNGFLWNTPFGIELVIENLLKDLLRYDFEIGE